MEQDTTTEALIAKMRRVRQQPETWLYSIRRAPSWITPKEGRPYRPFLFLVLDERTGRVLASQIEDELAPAAALSTLARAVVKPLLGAGSSRRPTEVRINREDISQALAPLLAQIRVRCSYHGSLPQADKAVRSLGAYIAKEELPRGLLGEPHVTVPLVAQFYTVAAEYYRQAPWRWIDDSQPIEVQCSGEDRPRYAVILGHGGEAYGLALYESLDDLHALYGSAQPEGQTMRLRSVAVLFEEQRAMTFDDLDALEDYGWPIAGEKAYPAVHKVIPGARSTTTPTLSDLSCVTAVLSVLPNYVLKFLRADSGWLDGAVATYPLSGVLQGQEITLRYPVYADGEEELDEELLSKLRSSLELFIQGWYTDDVTHALAREVGAVLLTFVADLASSGLSMRTVERHMRNCWWIGRLVCHYGDHKRFTPTMFIGEPKYLAELVKEFDPSPTALSAYQATWRKLSRYVRSIDKRESLDKRP